jgi:Cysteine-rich CPXCG
VIQTRIGDFILDKEAIQSRDYCVATNAMLRADGAPSAALEISVRGSDAAQAPQLSLRKRALAQDDKKTDVGQTRMESSFQCAGCGEWNATTVDDSAGRKQSYVEDCQVCCKPNLLHVEYDSAQQVFVIRAELE